MTTAESTEPRPAAAERLRTSEYVGYALGDTASNLFFQTFNIFLTYYYVDVWALAASSVSWMMLTVRLWTGQTEDFLPTPGPALPQDLKRRSL